MELLNKDAAIDRMNKLGNDEKPFIFFISYDMCQSCVLPIESVDSEECLYNFEGITNDTPQEHSTSEIEWKPNPIEFNEYAEKFKIVSDNMHAGNCYLANLTCRIPVTTNLTLKQVYRLSKSRFKLWIKDNFVCFSPEIFIRIADNAISSYPMKGTIDATLPNALEELMNNEKEAAEHATIVDLIRNDMSIIADKVHVKRYRYAETIKTNKGSIIQTSSEIHGLLRNGWQPRLGEILFSQLPAGSITGAPKPSTVRILEQAENYQRGFYTGIMGHFDGRKLNSAVMIRFIDIENGLLYFKAGGGITAKSNAIDEYNEVIQKVYVPIY